MDESLVIIVLGRRPGGQTTPWCVPDLHPHTHTHTDSGGDGWDAFLVDHSVLLANFMQRIRGGRKYCNKHMGQNWNFQKSFCMHMHLWKAKHAYTWVATVGFLRLTTPCLWTTGALDHSGQAVRLRDRKFLKVQCISGEFEREGDCRSSASLTEVHQHLVFTSKSRGIFLMVKNSPFFDWRQLKVFVSLLWWDLLAREGGKNWGALINVKTCTSPCSWDMIRLVKVPRDEVASRNKFIQGWGHSHKRAYLSK